MKFSKHHTLSCFRKFISFCFLKFNSKVDWFDGNNVWTISYQLENQTQETLCCTLYWFTANERIYHNFTFWLILFLTLDFVGWWHFRISTILFKVFKVFKGRVWHTPDTDDHDGKTNSAEESDGVLLPKRMFAHIDDVLIQCCLLYLNSTSSNETFLVNRRRYKSFASTSIMQWIWF